jgi:hypothetical protein
MISEPVSFQTVSPVSPSVVIFIIRSLAEGCNVTERIDRPTRISIVNWFSQVASFLASKLSPPVRESELLLLKMSLRRPVNLALACPASRGSHPKEAIRVQDTRSRKAKSLQCGYGGLRDGVAYMSYPEENRLGRFCSLYSPGQHNYVTSLSA